MELASKYSPAQVEGKWYQYWMDNKLFSSKPDGREPYTVVIPPPNVTGVLHMGHVLNETIQDIHGLDASPTRADNTPIFRPGATNVVGSAIQCRGGLFLPDEALAAWAAPHAAAVSIEAWVHGNGALSNDQKILSSYSSWNHGIALRLNDRYWYGAGNIRQWPSDYAIGNDAWKHLAAAWSATDNIGYVRVDGALALSGLHGAEDLGFAQYSLTSNGGNGEVFRGLADEFRVRRGVSSADWTQAVYDTSRPGTDFLTYGEMHQLLGLTIMVR